MRKERRVGVGWGGEGQLGQRTDMAIRWGPPREQRVMLLWNPEKERKPEEDSTLRR